MSYISTNESKLLLEKEGQDIYLMVDNEPSKQKKEVKETKSILYQQYKIKD